MTEHFEQCEENEKECVCEALEAEAEARWYDWVNAQAGDEKTG